MSTKRPAPGAPDPREFMKLEDHMAKMRVDEAMSAGLVISVMAAAQLGCSREFFLEHAANTFDAIAPEMKKGVPWIIQSRTPTSGSSH